MNHLCVVFDIDDTLYLERDYVLSGFAAVGPWARDWLAIPDFAERCGATFEAGVRGSVFNHVLAECGVDPAHEVIAALVAIYRAHVPAVGLCEDARELLTEASRRWPLAVISDGPAVSQSRKAEALGLGRFASPILLTELLGRECSKPSPAAFRKVEEGIRANRYIYVADNPRKDFFAPRELGWGSVRVRRPGGLHFGVEGGGAEVEMGDLSGLMGWLEGI
jgi:putative hydrolase of the HAD superfamily